MEEIKEVDGQTDVNFEICIQTFITRGQLVLCRITNFAYRLDICKQRRPNKNTRIDVYDKRVDKQSCFSNSEPMLRLP